MTDSFLKFRTVYVCDLQIEQQKYFRKFNNLIQILCKLIYIAIFEGRGTR